jgi:hypothetical protein
LDGIELIVHRRSRTGKVEDLIDFDIQRERDVVAHELEARTAHEVSDVASAAGEEVVYAQDFLALLE